MLVRDTDFCVLEGNSRLAAYRALAERNPIEFAMMKCVVVPSGIADRLIYKPSVRATSR